MKTLYITFTLSAIAIFGYLHYQNYEDTKQNIKSLALLNMEALANGEVRRIITGAVEIQIHV